MRKTASWGTCRDLILYSKKALKLRFLTLKRKRSLSTHINSKNNNNNNNNNTHVFSLGKLIGLFVQDIGTLSTIQILSSKKYVLGKKFSKACCLSENSCRMSPHSLSSRARVAKYCFKHCTKIRKFSCSKVN